ncbi:MAG: hypothetical protein HY043_08830 [Verrucomicrobia bacterium]|nr:hypothetical protein [Verrucomicrobiota bacterium]
MKIKALLGITGVLALAAGTGRAQVVDTVITNGLFEPHSIAVDTNNNYYITDGANNRVVKYTQDTGVLTSLAGLKGKAGTNDGPGIQTRFFDPKGIIYVPALDVLVVADSGNHTLRQVTLLGQVTTIAGVPGVPGNNDGPANLATFRFPDGLAADADGNIFIADSKNNAIRKLDTNNIVTTYATAFYEPSGVAVGDFGEIIVADTRNHSIKLIEPDGSITLLAGSDSRFVSGTDDSPFATSALFNGPTGLIWLGLRNGLIVSDSGNHTLRRVYFNDSPDVSGFSVETFAGTPGVPGLVDGKALVAKFNNTIGLSRDLISGGFLVVDLANNAVRRIQTSAPQPPVRDPVLGWVDYVKDAFGDLVSKLVPVTQAVFNNDVTIAILPEPATETFFTYGVSPPSPVEDTIPAPSRKNGNTPPPYEDGLHASEVPPSIISAQPDVTIKVIGTADGRRPSAVVQGRFQFKTANPIIIGDNPALFVVSNVTASAQMFYTTDGSDPTGDSSNLANSPPIVSGQQIQLTLPPHATNLIFKIRAFRSNFKDSEIIKKEFSATNFLPNQISFGFESGEASSDFVGSAGQTFYAPVTLSLLPKQTMFGLQFNLTVTNLSGPSPQADLVGFTSMLKKPIPGTTPPIFVTIPNQHFLAYQYLTNIVGTNFLAFTNLLYQDLLFTNSTANLLGVGWLERFGHGLLFDSTKQDLITFSQAHDTMFLSVGGKVVTGGYSFVIPNSAADGDTYQIQVGRPSATSDGVAADVFIDTPTDGSLTDGPINAIKVVTVGQRRYLVGDVAPFRWFNAGDFGNTNLLNNDVMQVFQSAIYSDDMPPPGSDFFDAMDSSDGTINPAAFDGNDQSINNVVFGDGVLDVTDVFVTFRRSLDPTLKWFDRYWQNGARTAVEHLSNNFRGSPNRPAEQLIVHQPNAPAEAIAAAGSKPSVTLTVGEINAGLGRTVAVPLPAEITGGQPLRVLMLHLKVSPQNGAPDLTQPVRFVAAEGLGQPALTSSRGVANFAGAWLDNQVAGVRGATSLGTLYITAPADAPDNSAYKIEVDHFSASPNGLSSFAKFVKIGGLVATNAPVSTMPDGIPDDWRIRYFGSVGSAQAAANADPDGDGIPNWAEFKAGTNPNDAQSALRLSHKPGALDNGFTLQWPTVADKIYLIECAPALTASDWLVISPRIVGTGQPAEFTHAQSGAGAQFYRVRVVE